MTVDLSHTDWPSHQCKIVRGHQVASGFANDTRFPDGTLKLQLPHFKAAGLDLTDWHLATLNLSLAPCVYAVAQPRLTFRQVKWHPDIAAEDFSFMDCRVENQAGLVYYPHPETKPDHEQPEDVLEVLLPVRLPEITYCSMVRFAPDPGQVRLMKIL
jgi:hypothetical protein